MLRPPDVTPSCIDISLCHFVFADFAAKMGVGSAQIPAKGPCEPASGGTFQTLMLCWNHMSNYML